MSNWKVRVAFNEFSAFLFDSFDAFQWKSMVKSGVMSNFFKYHLNGIRISNIFLWLSLMNYAILNPVDCIYRTLLFYRWSSSSHRHISQKNFFILQPCSISSITLEFLAMSWIVVFLLWECFGNETRSLQTYLSLKDQYFYRDKVSISRRLFFLSICFSVLKIRCLDMAFV